MMIDFEGRVAVVTGGAGGIGRATGRMMHAAGATVVVADLDEAAAQAFAAELDAGGARAWGIGQDARLPEDAERLAAAVGERHGRCDILVTGAGLFPQCAIDDMDAEAWRQVIAINLDGVHYTSRALLPLMGEGSAMVHIASLAGHKGAMLHAHYASAKAGVLGYSRSLAHELAPRGIRVNAISPGIIATSMTDQLMERKGNAILAATPMGRMGTADEVASVICFLASDLASFVTGESLHVNGGYYIAS